ncbi:MAG TPA: carbon-nitrogen hydrolase family protein [Acidobacteriota bacterium]|nr:carbon-nitrogen hydrolase family protein [Acidobacteriota bacterium]
MVISVAALQYPIGRPIGLEDTLHLFRLRPDCICLPEYFAVAPDARSHADGVAHIEETLESLARLSRDLDCVAVGGTLAHPVDGGYANVCTVFDGGRPAGSYQKMNPVGREEERGIIAGTEARVFDVRGIKIGVLICADALVEDSFKAMNRLGADVVFIPTVSPLLDDDTVFAKDRRDNEIFVAGARRACAYVVKTCGVGTIFGGRLQGRSGIFAPWGVLKRVTPDSEDRKLVLTENLDLDEIREFKRMMDTGAMARAETSSSDMTPAD